MILLRPWWLLALPMVIALAWHLWSRRGALGDWERVADPGLLQVMTSLGRVDGQARRGPLIAGLVAAALIVLALAGPAVERRDSLSFRNLDGVILAVDASASMMEHPRWPEMQATGRFGLGRLGTRPGALIVFGGDAYEVAEMTLDHVELGQSFSLIEVGLVPDPGSRPARALALAADRLGTAGVIAGDVILMTDGAGLGAATLAEAERIMAAGARLSVVTFAPGPAVESLAQIGGGRVFGANEAEAFGDWLEAGNRTRLEQQAFPLLYWRDLGRYLVVLVMVPLLGLFRRTHA